jgi:hypothetical protein
VSGVEDIAAERARQAKKGWTDEHDDSHLFGELGQAAAVYASPFLECGIWPWEVEADHSGPKYQSFEDYRQAMTKASNRRERKRELAKAGALIAAEIDRLDRL